MRRYAYVRIAAELITKALLDGERPAHTVRGGLPTDATLIGVRHNYMDGTLDLLFQSHTFEPLAEGADAFDAPQLTAPMFVHES